MGEEFDADRIGRRDVGVVADLGEDLHSTCGRFFQVNIEMKVK